MKPRPWTVRRRRRDEVVFVLGAGASVDAGLPTAAQLTAHLRAELSARLPWSQRLVALVDALRGRTASLSNSPPDSYEEIFWWLRTILDNRHFCEMLGVDRENYKIEYSEIARASRDIITEHLASSERRGDASYLARIADFARDGRAVKVFTLNYDTCVERACREHEVSITTGFAGVDRHHRGWKPHLLRDSRASGVLLHKLHGSLTWFGSDPRMYEDLEPPDPTRPKPTYARRPELVLGPRGKEQPDDPFAWLLNRFHETLKVARTCVVIGFGWTDPHVAERIRHEHRLGLDVVEVSVAAYGAPTPRMRGRPHGAYRAITGRASLALRDGSIGRAMDDARRVLIR